MLTIGPSAAPTRLGASFIASGLADMYNNNGRVERDDRTLHRARWSVPLALIIAIVLAEGVSAQAPGQPFKDSVTIGEDRALTIRLVVGDVDGDGDRDVVEVKEGALNRVFINDGSGGLVERSAIGNDADDVANGQGGVIVDLDNDSKADLVVVNSGSPSRIYKGHGDGTFDPGVNLSPDSLDARGVAAADLDGNGYVDLVVATSGDTNRIFLNDGTGSFVESLTPVSSDTFDTRAVVLADFDGDGRADLLEGNYSAPIMLYFGNGAGGFGAGIPVNTFPENTVAVAVRDLDGDGHLDVVEASLNRSARYFLNSGANTFTGVDLPGGAAFFSSVDVGDFNGDSLPDIVLGIGDSFTSGPKSALYLADGSGGFTAAGSLSSHAGSTSSVALIDLDADLDLDAVEGVYGGVNRSYTNDPVGTFTQSGTFSADNLQTYGAALGDVDGDGDIDVVEAKRFAANMLFLNDGTGKFSEGTPVTAARSTNAILLVDVDGDGDLDIVEGNGGDGNRIYRNDGTGRFDAGTDFGPQTDVTRGIAAADLDGDGHVDLVVANSDGPNRIYLNDGSGNFPAAVDLDTAGFEPSWAVTIGDVNGDGAPDIVVGNYGLPVRIYFNDGNGGFASGVSLGDIRGTRQIALADVDGDGDLDIITGNSAAGGNDEYARDHVYYNDGTGGFPTGVDLTQDPDETFGLAVGDVDGDGHVDVVTGNRGGRNVLYLNDGAGGFVAGTTISTDALDTLWLGLADADGSGTPDLFTMNKDDVGRLHLNGNPTTSGLTDVTVDEDAPPFDVPLYPAFADLEDADSALTFTVVDDTNPSLVGTAVANGTLTLTFAPNGNGAGVIRVRATDTDGLFVDASFTVTVTPQSDSPAVVAPIPDQTATAGVAYMLNAATAFVDVDGDPLTYTALGLPPTLSIDSASGVISGTPTAADRAGSPYTVTVRASSGVAGETPASSTFALRILDTSPPVITVIGANPATVALGSAYVDRGASATDPEDGDLTAQIVVTNGVDTTTVGTYTVMYRVTDSSGNVATAARTVRVVADAPPVLTLNGSNPLTIEGGHPYADPGATANRCDRRRFDRHGAGGLRHRRPAARNLHARPTS